MRTLKNIRFSSNRIMQHVDFQQRQLLLSLTIVRVMFSSAHYFMYLFINMLMFLHYFPRLCHSNRNFHNFIKIGARNCREWIHELSMNVLLGFLVSDF